MRALVDRLLATGTGRFDSQTALIRALRAELRGGDVAQRVGAPRLRAILHEMAGVRVDVRYRVSDGPVRDGPCPVCSAPLRPIHNATLSGGRVVAGQRCARCGYWRHGRARTPTRYTILRVRAGRTRRPAPPAPGA